MFTHEVSEIMATDQILPMATDQFGCRALQVCIDAGNEWNTHLIFDAVLGSAVDLSKDRFGNYLIQKLIQVVDEDSLISIGMVLCDDAVELAKDVHGTRVIQKLLQRLRNQQLLQRLCTSFKASVIDLSVNTHGNHVIQTLLRVLPTYSQFIYDSCEEHCITIATQKHGCCVVQKCLDFATPKQSKSLMKVVIRHAYSLVQNQYANYVISYIIAKNEEASRKAVIMSLSGNFARLSMQKYSSNVIEKCLKLSSGAHQKIITRELFRDIPRLLRDPFGNYVIQTALRVSSQSRYLSLIGKLKPHLGALQKSSFGKRIYTKLVQKFPDLSQDSEE